MLPVGHSWHSLNQRRRALSLSGQIAQIGAQDRHDALHIDGASALGFRQDHTAHSSRIVRATDQDRAKAEAGSSAYGVRRWCARISLDAPAANPNMPGHGHHRLKAQRRWTNLGFLKEADEFPNHAGKSGAQDFRRSVPRTMAPMLSKPLDDDGRPSARSRCLNG